MTQNARTLQGYVIGGNNVAQNFTDWRTVYVLKVGASAPTTAPMLNKGRYAASAALWNNQIVVCGGYDNNATVNPPPMDTCETLVLPGSTKWTMTGALPKHVANGCMLTINGTVNDVFPFLKVLFSFTAFLHRWFQW